jgi:hypothetical protein
MEALVSRDTIACQATLEWGHANSAGTFTKISWPPFVAVTIFVLEMLKECSQVPGCPGCNDNGHFGGPVKIILCSRMEFGTQVY